MSRAMTSEAWPQVEHEHPSRCRSVKGPRQVELSNGVAEHVYSRADTGASDPVAVCGGQRWEGRSRRAGPGHTGVEETEELSRNRSVVDVTAKPEQRNSSLEVDDGDAAADEAVECRAGAVGRHFALAGLERVDVVPADHRRITKEHRHEPLIFAAASIASGVQRPQRQRQWTNGHHVLPEVGSGRDEVEIAGRWRHFQPEALAEDGTCRAEG